MFGGLIQTHGRNCPLILLLSLANHNRLGALATLAKGNDGDLFSLGSMPAGAELERRPFILMGQNQSGGVAFPQPTDGLSGPDLRYASRC